MEKELRDQDYKRAIKESIVPQAVEEGERIATELEKDRIKKLDHNPKFLSLEPGIRRVLFEYAKKMKSEYPELQDAEVQNKLLKLEIAVDQFDNADKTNVVSSKKLESDIIELLDDDKVSEVIDRMATDLLKRGN